MTGHELPSETGPPPVRHRRWDVRAAFLMAIGLGAIARGWAYLPGVGQYTVPSALQFLPGSFGLSVWGWLWVAAGAGAVTVAFTGYRHPESTRYAGFLLVLIGTIWGVAYIAGWIYSISHGVENRDWFSGLVFLSVALSTAFGTVMSIRYGILTAQVEAVAEDARRQIAQLEHPADESP